MKEKIRRLIRLIEAIFCIEYTLDMLDIANQKVELYKEINAQLRKEIEAHVKLTEVQTKQIILLNMQLNMLNYLDSKELSKKEENDE